MTGVWVVVIIAALCGPLAALQREIKSKAHNYPKAPVQIQDARIVLLEKFAAPNQFVLPGSHVHVSRVRYANRAGLSPSLTASNPPSPR